jgi:hypothetical protein
MWSSWRRRRGIPTRIVHDHDLIPWHIRLAHNGRFAVAMLRAEARKRQGLDLSARQERDLKAFRARLKRDGLVVAYDPDTEEGFFLTPRLPEDKDIIRQPPPELRTEAYRLDSGVNPRKGHDAALSDSTQRRRHRRARDRAKLGVQPPECERRAPWPTDAER